MITISDLTYMITNSALLVGLLSCIYHMMKLKDRMTVMEAYFHKRIFFLQNPELYEKMFKPLDNHDED